MYKNTDKKYTFERLVYTPPDLSPRFICKVNLSNTNRFRNTKIRPDFFYFGLLFRQSNATCKLATTEDYRVLHKIMFWGCPIIPIVSPTEWLERLYELVYVTGLHAVQFRNNWIKKNSEDSRRVQFGCERIFLIQLFPNWTSM